MLKIIAISNGMGGQSQDIAPLLYEHHPALKEFWENTIILNIFADTGDEEDKMYNLTIPRYQQYLQDHNWQELIIINRHQTHGIPELKMSEYYINHNAMPTRQFRHCTDRFKIQVVRKYLKLFLEKWHLSLKDVDIRMLIGFTIDEAHRMRDSDVKWIKNEFPFIYNLKWNKQQSKIDLAYRFLFSYKSGCYYCIYLSVIRAYNNIKDDEEKKAIVIEMEGRVLLKRQHEHKEPIYLFGNTSIKKLIKMKDSQTKLAQFIPNLKVWDESDKCDSGYCFV